MKSFVKLDHYKEWIYYLILTIAIGSVYFITLLPGTGYSGDTAKFQFLGKVMGIPHSTGYPTYLIINHFFTKFFPFGSLALKVNLLSAIFSIIASIVFFKLLCRFISDKEVSLYITLTMAFSYTIWSQSIVAEVYTFNLVYVAFVLYYFVCWYQTKLNQYFYLATAFYAFSFGNHLTMITFLPAIIYLVLSTDKKAFLDIKKVLFVIIFIVISASQYVYLFWRCSDPSTAYLDARIIDFRSFWDFVTGAGFKAYMFSIPILYDNLPWLTKEIFSEYLFLIPIAIYGIFTEKSAVLRNFLLLSAFGNIIFSASYGIPDVFVYFMPTYLIIAIFIGIGCQAILSCNVLKKHQRFKSLLIFAPVILLIVNFNTVNQRDNKDAVYVKEWLKAVGSNAVIVSPSEHYLFGYDFYEYLQYYIIGEDFGKKYNDYVFPLLAIKDVYDLNSYILNGKPIHLKLENRTIPPGLTVYCANRLQAMEIKKRTNLIIEDVGLTNEQNGFGLYRIRAVGK